ncbi:MAG: HD domain-containing protein [Synechococcaceae cyanobacterium]|nr:HD domain-containing protein [Synechococcaceae cyanobacterium]
MHKPEASQPLAHSQSYSDALAWAAELHGRQRRKGKEVPYISHLIAVSALVWEDCGQTDQPDQEHSEELAIAALLHDAIEDCGITQDEIAERFGERVARIVADCTDTDGAVAAGGEKAPWFDRKTRYIEHLHTAPLDSLLVSAADKAHNARDMVLDARRDPALWKRFNAGLDGSAWYLHSLHEVFRQRLEGSRSVELLGEAVREILASEAYLILVTSGTDPVVHAKGYPKRHKEAEAKKAV